MAHSYRQLSIQNPARHITVCSHGVVHTSWDGVTLRLKHHDFIELNRFLRSVAATVDDHGGNHANHFRRHGDGRVELWLFGMGLYLSEADLLLLTDLVHTAVYSLQNVAAEHPAWFTTTDSKHHHAAQESHRPEDLN